MQGLFLEYKDPLFGLIVFVFLIFLVALLTYIWNLYTTRYSNRHLVKFINSFNETSSSQELTTLITSSTLPQSALELLSSNYYKAGNYEQTIEICLELLKKIKKPIERRDNLFLLAKSYYKAGFYKRAESSFVELLRLNAREPEALAYLIIIYERLLRFNEAFDALLPLKEMGLDISRSFNYLKVTQVIKNPKQSLEEKAEALLNIYKDEPAMIRPVFMFLFRNLPDYGWKHLPLAESEMLIDILWNLPKESLNFDIIASDNFLKALYFAKGFYENFAICDNFELNILNQLSPSSNTEATLAFEYVCSTCKELTPLMNHRCPHCMGLLTLSPTLKIVKHQIREGYYSF